MPRNNAKNRRRIEQKYDSLYKPHYLNGMGFCVYCGDRYPETVDHVPPLSWVDSYGTEYFVDKDIQLLKVVSCSECNAALGDKPYFTVRQRKSYISMHLRKKFDQVIQNRPWEDDEIDELDGRLKEYIQVQHEMRLLLERRLDFASSD